MIESVIIGNLKYSKIYQKAFNLNFDIIINNEFVYMIYANIKTNGCINWSGVDRVKGQPKAPETHKCQIREDIKKLSKVKSNLINNLPYKYFDKRINAKTFN